MAFNNKKGLGRGLGSLLGGAMFDDEQEKESAAKAGINEEVIQGDAINEVEIKDIIANPNQPRKNFDPAALKELSESIKQHGVIQPILVCRQPDGIYMIIAGERRFRASKLAGLKAIPAIIKDYTPQEIKEVSLLENIQREDLNPIETARAMRELMDIYGWTQDQLADRLAKSRPAVANLLRLLTLQPEVIALIESGKLSAGHARSLVVISDPAAQVKLAHLAITKKVTVRDLEKAVKELTQPKTKPAKERPSIELKELIEVMTHKFSTKVSFMGNDKKGKIVIDYYSKDDLDRISVLLRSLK